MRVLSSVVLVPPVVAAIYFGPPYLSLLLAVAALVLSWEWLHLCGDGGDGRDGIGAALFAGSALASVALAGYGAFDYAALTIAVGLVAVYTATRLSGGLAGWTAAGVAYVGLPCLAMAWLWVADGNRWDSIIWIVATVAATDIGAYFTGHALGGPRLAPRISPHKTWAGLIGGMLTAAAAGLIVAAALDRSAELPAAIAGAGMALISQCGDLVESAIKRRFGVKDMSGIIPGHGGMFDRVDGIVAGMVVVAALQLTTGGLVLEWHWR